MLMKKVALIATDLDGTLLNSQKKVSPKTRHLLQQAYRQGVRVVIATTRTVDFVQELCGMLEITDPIICANGAHILSAPFGEVWRNAVIPTDAALTIAQLADDHDWEIYSTIGAMKYLRQRPQQMLGPLSPNTMIVKTNADGIVGPPMRILLWHPAAIEFFRTFCQAELRHDCYTETYYDPNGDVHSLGIFPAGADKGSALALVLDHLNITPDEVLAIGDNDNDIALFSQAGVRVAMGNGTGALKSHATAIAPDHDNDGVGWAIDQFVL